MGVPEVERQGNYRRARKGGFCEGLNCEAEGRQGT